MLNRLTLTLVLLLGGYAFAEIPKNPTRDQIVASCIAKKVSVAERVALQGCKTKLDAAELLQSMYHERHDSGMDQMRVLMHTDPNASYRALQEASAYSQELLVIEPLIEELKAEAARPPKKKKK